MDLKRHILGRAAGHLAHRAPPEKGPHPCIYCVSVPPYGRQPVFLGDKDPPLHHGRCSGSLISHRIPRRIGRFRQHTFLPGPVTIGRFGGGPPRAALGCSPRRQHSLLYDYKIRYIRSLSTDI